MLFFVSDLLVNYWYLFLATPLVAGLIGLQRPHQPAGPPALRRHQAAPAGARADPQQDHPVALRQHLRHALRLGHSVLESIRTTQHIVGNHVIRRGLERVEQSIREGHNVAGAFHDVGLFPPLVVRMLRIGESTGGLDKALLNVSYFYNRDVKESVSKAQTLIEPMLTLFMGALLGWIMLSVIGPIYDVISKIKT
jgi:type IV pilus assembly protein PilC